MDFRSPGIEKKSYGIPAKIDKKTKENQPVIFDNNQNQL